MSFSYFPLKGEPLLRRKAAWEGLVRKQPFGRPALCFFGALPDREAVRQELPPAEDIKLRGQARRNADWDRMIRDLVLNLQVKANSVLQDDYYPAIDIPTVLYGQTQGVAELFGCKLIPQANEKNLYYPVPAVEDPRDLQHLTVKPVDRSFYGTSIEFARYAVEATDGQLSVRTPVMTGPLDTANYILGSMRLMTWIYDEPAALHQLLDRITDTIIDIIEKLKAATGGRICPEVDYCLDRGYGLCSEVRHLISAEAHAEFEAPYLRRISRACGLYAIHSCGTWERTIPALLADENLMLLNFQCREMDLPQVYSLTRGKVSISVKKSVDLDSRYTWENEQDFLAYAYSAIPEPIPVEIGIYDAGIACRGLPDFQT
jgi:hypothetical protein